MKPLQVFFNKKGSFDEYGMKLMEFPLIAIPKVKSEFVEIPFGDGSIDVSDVLTGYPTFENREFTLIFSLTWNHQENQLYLSKIQNELIGKKVKMTLENDPSYYLNTRIISGNIEHSEYNNHIFLEFECVSDPYKYKIKETIKTFNLKSGTTKINLYNDYLRVYPEIVSSVNLKINNIEFKSGERNFEFYLEKGLNEIIVESNSEASLTLKFREGRI